MEDRRTHQDGSEVWSHGTKSGRFSGSAGGWRVLELSTENWPVTGWRWEGQRAAQGVLDVVFLVVYVGDQPVTIPDSQNKAAGSVL